MKEHKTDELTEEEFAKRLDMLNENVQLQGAVQAPEFRMETMQMLYGPPPGMDRMGSMGFIPAPTPAPVNGKWLDAEKWECGCGQTNTGKFCSECGYPAPPREWQCPKCGTANKGNFCGECGEKRP